MIGGEGAETVRWFWSPFANTARDATDAADPYYEQLEPMEGEPVPCYPDARCLHVRQVCVLSSFSSADLEACVAKAHGVDKQAEGISTAAVVAIVIGVVVVAGIASAMFFRPVNTNAVDNDGDADDIQIELRVSERDMSTGSSSGYVNFVN
jgi:hypothetical protein